MYQCISLPMRFYNQSVLLHCQIDKLLHLLIVQLNFFIIFALLKYLTGTSSLKIQTLCQ